jgi:ferredoxin-type protein NapH
MKNENGWDISFKTLKMPLIFLLIFLGIGIWRSVAVGHIFYLLNFGYIGISIAVGGFLSDALPRKHRQWGRRIAQILVASYLLGYIGVALRENMQIEGFFFYLLMGVFAGATLHYFVAKVVGTFVLNRGWCGWACWTAMVLDLLPWRKPQNGRLRHLGLVRYVHFGLSLGLVLFVWYVLGERELFAKKTMAELTWLGVGNTLYYVVGITLAVVLKDNRAFCKYVCPIPVLQKIGARFALWRIKIDPDKCIDCGLCEKHCPMDIKLLDYKEAGQRILSTECILCHTCANVCPQSAISSTMNQFDIVREERLRYRDE